jgi:hypothetical protein
MTTPAFEDLKHMKIDDLRDLAKDIEHDAVQGYTQMNKAKLLEAVCSALGIEMHEHHDVVGIDKRAVKARIHALKKKRDEILASASRDGYKKVLRDIHRLKRQIRKATV